MQQRLPFSVAVRPWDDLAGSDRFFFCFEGAYLPLHPNHAAQIGLLERADAARVSAWAYSGVAPGWPDRTERRFAREARCLVRDSWNDAGRRAEVRRWLFERGVPFRRVVYLLYERDRVVQTTWRMVVRYWDAFAWSVGYAMLVVDHTLRWACCFHHEDVFVFGTHEPAVPAAPPDAAR
jgi:hypothetical protein